MTETPNGPHDPQQQHDTSSWPQPGRPPYAGPEWRRSGAPAPVGAAGAPTAPTAGAPDFQRPAGYAGDGRPAGGPAPIPPAAPPAPPAGAYGGGPGTPGGQPRYGATRHPGPAPAGPSGSPWPYPGPAPKRAGGITRLAAVAAVTAVLGGLAGGGAVALLEPGSPAPTVSAAGIPVRGGEAPAAGAAAGTVEAAAATAMRSVVTLSVLGGQGGGSGSGVVIRSDGYILTNEHVIAAAASDGAITVSFADGRTATATLVGADRATDLAVVKVDLTGLTAATFADSDEVRVGQAVVAVGSPLGLDGTVTQGIVSALHRPTTGGSDNSAVIDAVQTDAAINPGNSGGALVDLAGRVVGINQSIAVAGSGQYGQAASGGNIGLGFAIPADTATRVAAELIADGTASHAYLGVQTRSTTPAAAGSTRGGATVASVEAGGPAAAAGLRVGDVVTKLDDRVIDTSEDLVAAVRSYAPDTEVALTVRRGSGTEAVTVTLGSDAKE